MCKFVISWVGYCKNEADESGYCEKHRHTTCSSCGKQATRDCEETSFLVCGAPLCEDCEHTTNANGCNSGAPLPEGYKVHCCKEKQVYKVWYARDNGEDVFTDYAINNNLNTEKARSVAS